MTSSSNRRAARSPRSSSLRGRALLPASEQAAGRLPRALPFPGAALGRGIAMAYLSIVALIPLAALVVRSMDGGLDTFWNAVTNDQAVAALRLTLIASVIVVVVNAVTGTLIAWVLVRRVPRQGDRELADRPSVRPSNDRRRPDASRVLWPRQPGRREPGVHQGLGGGRAPVRDASLRGPGRSARAPRARYGDGGGGRIARRRQGDRVSPDRLAEPGAGDPRRRRAGLRPCGRRIRLARPDHRHAPVRHGGRLGLHLRPSGERRSDRRIRCVRRAACRRARRAAVLRVALEEGAPA